MAYSENHRRQKQREATARWRENPESRAKEKAGKYYAENRDRYQAQYIKNRDYLWSLKSDLGCSTCGEKDPRCLEFHHRDPETKRFNLTSHGCRTKSLDDEVKKCIVLCANCHAKLHYDRNKEGELTFTPS